MKARRTDRLPTCAVFSSVDEASAFFQAGSLGYSVTNDPACYQGLELHCFRWRIEPLEVCDVRSSFFDDESIFSPSAIEFDSAFLMHDIEHEWRERPAIHATLVPSAASLCALTRSASQNSGIQPR